MPDQLKYGRIERERRYLLDAVPPAPVDQRWRITDRYITGSRLRLRTMADLDTGEVVYKLARKLPPRRPGVGVMGNLYLSAHEHALLDALPGPVLVKVRHKLGAWSVDAFEGVHAGLVLAECEVDDDDALAALVPPFPVVREVTADATFSGAALARLVPGAPL